VQIARLNPNFERADKAAEFTGFGLLPGSGNVPRAEKGYRNRERCFSIAEIGNAVSQ
jgi:hypothetical protein